MILSGAFMKRRYENDIVTPAALDARAKIAAELKQTRLAYGLTQQALADRAGTKCSNISRMESGKYNPSIDFLTKIATCLNKTIEIHLD